ncbi:MAG: hypothetical protein Q8J78_12985 [Moraxellaceae bacterium]|nr:hypothetical protein [Moraxellaceae bacterium]
MTSIYTFVIDYDGGTYLRQIKARGVRKALIKFITVIQKDKDYVWGKSMADDLIEFARMGVWPVRVEGLENVWCTSSSALNKFALINIVKTKSP